MNRHESIRYLNAVNNQLGGVFQTMPKGKGQKHALIFTRGVIARLLVNEMVEPRFIDSVAAALQDWKEELQSAEIESLSRIDLKSHLGNIERLLVQAENDVTVSIKLELAKLLNKMAAVEEMERLRNKIISMDHSMLVAMEAEYARLISIDAESEERGEEQIDVSQQSRILEFIKKSSDEHQDLVLSGVSILSGGFSKRTILIELENTRSLPANLIIRHDRPESPVGTSVAEEFPLLQVLHDAGIKVPRPYFLDDGDIVGSPLMLLEQSDGSVIADGHRFHVPTEGLSGLALSLAEELAKLHCIPLDKVPESVPGRTSSNETTLIEEINEYREIWGKLEEKCLAAEGALDWMEQNIDLCGADKVLTHGDIRFHNVLVKDHGVSAILDWELASLSHPALDIAYTYHHVSQIIDWREFLSHYQSCGGPTIHPDTLKFYALRCELLTSSYLTRFHTDFVEGQNCMIDLAYAGSHLRQQNIFILSDRLQLILSGKSL